MYLISYPVMGKDSRNNIFSIQKQQILELYKAGPDAVVSFITQFQDLVNNLGQRVEEQQRIIEHQEERVQEQGRRIQELEALIKRDSHNSNKPPSSDGYTKRPVGGKKESGRRPGGQRGHEGNTLRMVGHPDKVVEYKVAVCGSCGKSLKKEKVIEYDRRQVFDIPPIKVEVTEHRGEKKVCARCGEVSTAVFPEGITHKAQYGNRLKAYAVYIKNYGLLSYERAAELFEDLFSVPLSAGTLVNIDQNISERLAGVVERIKQNIIASSVAHFDETGMRIEGKLHWLHVAGTNELTYYMPHQKRGNAATDAIGILPTYQGRAIHDNWKSYFNYRCCEHGLCNAHHIRELTFMYEQYAQKWAKDMIDFLLEVKEKREKTNRRGFDPETIKEYENRYRRIITAGMRANPPPVEDTQKKKRGRKKKSKALNLVERLRQREKATLAFMYDFTVPFDNNLAERDIRMMKVQQKISGTFRSFEGAVSFCRIRSYISTVKKQGMSVIAAIQDAFAGDTLVPHLVWK